MSSLIVIFTEVLQPGDAEQSHDANGDDCAVHGREFLKVIGQLQSSVSGWRGRQKISLVARIRFSRLLSSLR